MKRSEPPNSESSGFAALFERSARAVHAYAAAITRDRDTSDEIVQEVFLEAWRKRRKFGSWNDGDWLPWLLVTCRHKALKTRDRNARRHRTEGSFDGALVEAADARGRSRGETLHPRCPCGVSESDHRPRTSPFICISACMDILT